MTQIGELKHAQVLKNHRQWEWREMHYSDCSDKSGATNVGSLAHSLLLQTSTNRENHGQLHSKVADMKFNVHLGHLTLNFM